ncbi:MAG: prolipoprotein diacylglyceryl transferase family protein [Nonlabens sp.]
MNFPIQPELFGVSLPLHFIFETLAFVMGYRYYAYLRKRQGDAVEHDKRLQVIIGAAAGALLGSRLLGAMEQPLQWWEAEHFWLYLYTNKTVVGGFVGGLIGVELTKKIVGVKRSTGDLFTFPLILALIIGRIGCFCMGVAEETYGVATTLLWGMDLGDGILRHPVTLYEILFLVLLFMGLKWIQKNKNLKSGMLFQFFMIAYVLYRLLQDFIKPTFNYDFIHLSSIQIVCILTLIYYLNTIYNLIFKPIKLLDY